MLKWVWLSWVLVVGVLAACGATASATVAGVGARSEAGASGTAAAGSPVSGGVKPAGEIVVFTAASLMDAFKEIGALFETRNPGAKVAFNFGASSQLRTQLAQGARADVFASADRRQLDEARKVDLIAGPDQVFARNRLIVIVPKSNPGGVARLVDLAKPGLKLVTTQPNVPIGQYTAQMLEKLNRDPAFGADFHERVEKNVVSREDNVRQVVAKVQLGEADAGVVYSSDVTPAVADKLTTVEVPDQFNELATYPIAIVRDAPQPVLAKAFVDLVLSPDGQAVLQRWGFVARE